MKQGISICGRAYTRRRFLTNAALASPAIAADRSAWRSTWDAALRALAANVRTLASYNLPLLLEGSVYEGVWQECAPQEGLAYARLAASSLLEMRAKAAQVSRNNHLAFFALQRPDGQLPASIKNAGAGFAQIQMVVPIAATAWELAHLLGDEELLQTTYSACARWDRWLRNYRDTRRTGLVEGFCTYDTGMDHSPRWAGMPNRCPDGDARACPPIASLPRLCPDLSATVYGGRVALAKIAVALGKKEEAADWEKDAESIRQLIIDRLYDPSEASFFDVDAQNKFVRVTSVVNTRVLGEHVLDLSQRTDRAVFDSLWTRQLHNVEAFWAPYPLPSVTLNDPAFVRPIPRNSWGGASQALTALRAPRWMAHYGKQAELHDLMHRWCDAIVRSAGFFQQMNPMTGQFTQPDPGGYSPAALVFLEFARALSPDT